MSVPQVMQGHRKRLETRLDSILLPGRFPDRRLVSAMRYGVLGGGKRLRAMLAWAAAEAAGADATAADIPACALELMHAYSLIHDDLPAMDDDRLRRGRPTVHIRFDEATAILAGDALQTLAFELLGESSGLAVSDRTRLKMIGELARASGAAGMAGGQSLDIQAEGRHLDREQLFTIHRLKTGALIRASVLLGALSSLVVTSSELALLEEIAEKTGLAFQIRDDILDVTTATALLGKEQGRDKVLNKPTTVSILGLEVAEHHCSVLVQEALVMLEEFGSRAASLAGLIRYVAIRSY